MNEQIGTVEVLRTRVYLLDLFEQSIRDELTLFVGSDGDWFDVLVDRIMSSPHLAVLLAQVRADGAAEERERIAAVIDREADTPHLPTTQRAYLRTAARIARGGS